MTMLGSSMMGVGAAAGGVDIGDDVPYSLMLDSASSQYLSRTQGSPTDALKFTVSFWMKLNKYVTSFTPIVGTNSGTGANGDGIYLRGTAPDDQLSVFLGGATYEIKTTQFIRDPSAWMHIVAVIDTANATAGDRMRLHINGAEVTSFATDTNPTLSYDPPEWNTNTKVMYIGASGSPAAYLDSYLTDCIFVDGQALTPSSFGRTSADTGAWVHKTYAGTYGNNGFRLDFANSADLGNDVSGNNNDWTTNGGISSANQYTDTPTNNHCVLNVLNLHTGGGTFTYSKGNTAILGATTGDIQQATMGITQKSYWEITCGGTGSGNPIYGLTAVGYPGGATLGNNGTNGIGIVSTTGVCNYQNVSQGTYTSWTTNDIIMMAFDPATGRLWVGKNGTWMNSGDPDAGTGYLNGTALSLTTIYAPAIQLFTTTNTFNFGARTFSYKSGTTYKNSTFYPLNTANLAEPAIIYPAEHFFAKTRTGTGASYSVSGIGFQPDLVWVKGRSGATSHVIANSNSGTTKYLSSDATTTETTNAQSVTAFNSDGYSGGTMAAQNTNAATYVDWMWKGGNSAGSSNTNGSITTTAAANTTAGISVFSYSGTGANATVGHGLGIAPSFAIFKSKGSAVNWMCYHSAISPTATIFLNTTAAKDTNAVYFQNTAATSTVFSIGANANNNSNGVAYVCYAFAEVEGFSKFGSYTGNGSADGAFIYCGFQPALVLTKCSSTTGDWRVYDNERPGYNVQGGTLLANTAGAETTTAEIDIVSNGFKARITTDPNSAQTFIYAAFAALPMKYSTAR